MNPKKYNEFEVTFRNGEVFRKDLTERGSVSIDDKTAEIMNRNWKKTGILYELAEDENTSTDEKAPGKDDKEYRKELFAKAKDLEISHPKNIKTEDLETLIKEKE